MKIYKTLWIAGIIALALGIIFGICLFNAIEQYKHDYVLPDTSIVIHNGVPDTVITIKTLPFIFK